MLTDPDAARILSVTRGVAAAASAYRVLEDERLIAPLEHKGYLQVKAQRDAGRIDLPSPRFEDARMRRFLREVFELISYDRITDADAAQRLLVDGNALLARMK
jgi:oligogalacturonide transport system substrate-binding protein